MPKCAYQDRIHLWRCHLGEEKMLRSGDSIPGLFFMCYGNGFRGVSGGACSQQTCRKLPKQRKRGWTVSMACKSSNETLSTLGLPTADPRMEVPCMLRVARDASSALPKKSSAGHCSSFKWPASNVSEASSVPSRQLLRSQKTDTARIELRARSEVCRSTHRASGMAIARGQLTEAVITEVK